MNTKSKIQRVKELWLGLPETWRTELASAFHTFVPAFVSTLALFIQAGQGMTWSRETVIAFIVGAFLAAVRAGFKAVSVWFFARILPDPKD